MNKEILKLMTLALILAGGFTTCSKNPPLLEDEIISSNLLEMCGLSTKEGVHSALLIGDWDLIKFAYTADGKTITDVAEQPQKKGISSISDYINENGTPTWFFSYWCVHRVEYVLSPPNLITLSAYSIELVYITDPEYLSMVSAFNNAYSFAVKGDDLIIYFTGDKNKNLIIFKKV